MSEYVIQIDEDSGWLAKSFEVSEKSPIPVVVSPERVQVIMTNTASYEDIVAQYAKYGRGLVFHYDDEKKEISCTGELSRTWPIN